MKVPSFKKYQRGLSPRERQVKKEVEKIIAKHEARRVRQKTLWAIWSVRPTLNTPNPQSPHQWAPCALCGPMVRCGTCGNNSCNAGIGHLPEKTPWSQGGIECPDCRVSWEMAKGTPPPEIVEAAEKAREEFHKKCPPMSWDEATELFSPNEQPDIETIINSDGSVSLAPPEMVEQRSKRREQLEAEGFPFVTDEDLQNF